MRLPIHIIFTAPAAVSLYGMTGSWLGVIGIFISGIFIDIDHFLDYWYDRGMNLNIAKFFEYANTGASSRFFIISHSYELLPLLFMGTRLLSLHYLFVGLIAGMVIHLILDYINILVNFKYKWQSFIIFSFIFRALAGFRRDKIDKMVRHNAVDLR